MSHIKRPLLTAAIAMMAAVVCAQDNQLSVDAQLRTRGEHNNGAIAPHNEDVQSQNYVSERSRLSFNYKRRDLEVKATLQHTGMWGDDDLKQTNNHTSLNEAWAKLKSGSYFAQIGRMQLSYDDERILGASDWNNNGTWHNALRLGYEDYHHRLHIIGAMNQDNMLGHGDYYYGAMPYKNLQALWYHYRSELMPLGVSLLALNVGYDRGTENHGRTNYQQTFGTDITFRPGSWDIHAAGYYQMGKNYLRKVSAWMASGTIGYRFMPELTLSAGYDYMSGNDSEKDSWNAFDALYGTTHKFLGTMDYFGSTLSCGLQDIKGSLTAHICRNVKLNIDYHYLWMAQQVGDIDKAIGHEIDAQLTARLMKDVTLSAGYSTMLGTETLDRIKGGNHEAWQDWAWLQLNINPRILFTKW